MCGEKYEGATNAKYCNKCKEELNKKECLECGNTFIDKTKRKKFCDHACATKYNRRHRKIEISYGKPVS